MIKPALTAEGWAQKYHYSADIDPATGNLRINHDEGWVTIDGSASGKLERHAIAALALYGQPFGFTREDVEVLRREAYDEWYGASHPNPGDVMLSIAARIEALLPLE